jgi:hypothetical protein
MTKKPIKIVTEHAPDSVVDNVAKSNGKVGQDTFIIKSTDIEKLVVVACGVFIRLSCRVCGKLYARAILAQGSEIEGVCPRCRQTTVWRADRP